MPAWSRAGPAGLVLILASASCVPVGTARYPASASSSAPRLAGAASVLKVPPSTSPFDLTDIDPPTAMAMNAARPLSAEENPAAAAFSVRNTGFIDRTRALDCLADAVYYEAASESDDGQRAVAQVVLNRVRHPAYPSSVCGVVYQGSERATGCQFSFTCDGSLARRPAPAGWARARRIAAEALAGRVFAPVGHATHYHTDKVLPHWAPSLVKSAVIGAHIFYRWNGGWGAPAAFRQRYAGLEARQAPKPAIAALRTEMTALLAAGRQAEPAALPVAAPLQPPAASPAAAEEKDRLPKSEVLEIWRHSGMPLDQLPAASAR